MSSENPHATEAAQAYEFAYRIHQEQGDLLKAFLAYDRVMRQYPSAPEASYSRYRMRSIVDTVVPEDELWIAQYQLALRFLNPPLTVVDGED